MAAEMQGEAGAVAPEAVEMQGEAGAVAPEAVEKETGRMIRLTSHGGKTYDVTEASARQSKTIGEMIDAGRTQDISLPDIYSGTLEKMIEYCNKHATVSDREELDSWDEAFINKLDEDGRSVCAVIVASSPDHLDILGLHDLSAEFIASKIRGKTPQEIRDLLGIENDYTEEEEREILLMNALRFNDPITRMLSHDP
ncbi:SKP1-like protein 14 [Oryza brachyantha]|uniref:SKP1-like protein n=1 Tax=Oryza brachyantha TaxID=4533 RepID=J3MN53_ORYBR|nr:SKP1-like protein 14 [Oryza brachyantha]